MARGRRKPLYRSIAEAISEKVDEGDLVAGDKLPSERALCDIYEVSQITVRRALRELAYDGYVYSRHGLGWFVDDQGRNSENLRKISLLVPEGDSLAAPILETLLDMLPRQSLRLQPAIWPSGGGDEADPAEFLTDDNDMTIALVGGLEETLAARYQVLAEQCREPLLLLGRDVPDLDLPVVVLDEAECMRMATRHLLELGHRRIAYAGSNPAEVEGWTRYRGYTDAIWGHELELLMDWVFAFPLSARDREQLVDLLHSRRRPSAVVCSLDLWALDLMRILYQEGMRCPQDVALVGLGDAPYASRLPLALTSVRFELEGLARYILAAIESVMTNQSPHSGRVAGELIVRESCGANWIGDNSTDSVG